MQLFLLHFAGGSCYSFDFLREALQETLEFLPLELPGRGKRFHEALLKSKEAAIEDYCNQIKALRNEGPYIVFGHSMGATLGLSVSDKMEKSGDPPEALIVSGNAGPGILRKKREVPFHLLPDVEFKEVLKELGGVPEEVLANRELFDFFSPIMRADFEVLNSTFTEKKIRLNTSVYALMGDKEEHSDQIANWKNFTTSNFNSKVLKGNHFFIHDHKKELTSIIRQIATISLEEIEN